MKQHHDSTRVSPTEVGGPPASSSYRYEEPVLVRIGPKSETGEWMSASGCLYPLDWCKMEVTISHHQSPLGRNVGNPRRTFRVSSTVIRLGDRFKMR